ncbi:hypothetical protein SMGD1_1732 [Sulfurimonas gotlandica GD1]|uniref:DUF4139 domain-containing protein n=1 Tax=Sulfurimonas gotlandica (strain DSM 19862 / JCM 16533 / GD1) TaxID=929558 RepID=B6BIA5_SULGG|nr:hypothetical protein [Sulfurimonas gotlandica]EDZ63760.1 conserved hypothetical protein [Sulfurimonas gotlandica GD1]EHP30255.1 hypothetical protein SMGD1_1732 [Sulfurimonas gotlandica GD1]
MKTISLTLSAFILLSSSLFSASLSPKPSSSSLIVYNGGIGLVHEERELNLDRDDKQIIYEGVASTIETDSVNVALPNSVTLYSQQYRFDKLTMSKLLDAHINRKVKVGINRATLLSHNGENALVRDASNEIVSVLSKDIIFQSIPDSLLTKPSLVWNIEARKNLNTKMDIDYLINSLSWKSDYILNLNGDKADLTGWITIDNRSGKAYEGTNLYVLAGDINRAQRAQPQQRYQKAMAMMEAAPDVSHQAHEGYHFYTIPFKVNLANNEKTQIKFITQDAIDIKRRYSSTTSNPLYLQSEQKHNVTQYIEIKKLDLALPKGVVRTYSKLNSNNILLGESSLNHTPKDTPVNLALGKNFDLKVKETIESRSDTKSYLEATVLYTLKNSSDDKKTLEILIPFNKNTTSTIETSKAYTFKRGNTLSFEVVLDAKKTETFRVKFRSKR